MIKSILISVLIFVGFNANSQTQGPHAHPKHNMVLFGENEIFASHIVYKSPHNFQVILSLSLTADEQSKYLAAKTEHPSELFIYLLDPMDIKDIATTKSISGRVFYLDSAGGRHEVIADLAVASENFKVIYFDELLF
jgi:hypothetical protein